MIGCSVDDTEVSDIVGALRKSRCPLKVGLIALSLPPFLRFSISMTKCFYSLKHNKFLYYIPVII